jgi:hypothetical protein
MRVLELEIPVADDGSLLLKQAVGRLRGGGTEARRPTPAGASTTEPIIRLYQHVDRTSATRRLLEVLPGGRENGLTPEQLGSLLGDPALPKASVRAIIRNAKRAEAGIGGEVGDVVKTDFSGYTAERAGRYYVEPDQRNALDGFLGR